MDQSMDCIDNLKLRAYSIWYVNMIFYVTCQFLNHFAIYFFLLLFSLPFPTKFTSKTRTRMSVCLLIWRVSPLVTAWWIHVRVLRDHLSEISCCKSRLSYSCSILCLFVISTSRFAETQTQGYADMWYNLGLVDFLEYKQAKGYETAVGMCRWKCPLILKSWEILSFHTLILCLMCRGLYYAGKVFACIRSLRCILEWRLLSLPYLLQQRDWIVWLLQLWYSLLPSQPVWPVHGRMYSSNFSDSSEFKFLNFVNQQEILYSFFSWCRNTVTIFTLEAELSGTTTWLWIRYSIDYRVVQRSEFQSYQQLHSKNVKILLKLAAPLCLKPFFQLLSKFAALLYTSHSRVSPELFKTVRNYPCIGGELALQILMIYDNSRFASFSEILPRLLLEQSWICNSCRRLDRNSRTLQLSCSVFHLSLHLLLASYYQSCNLSSLLQLFLNIQFLHNGRIEFPFCYQLYLFNFNFWFAVSSHPFRCSHIVT